jgi:hypothetical protein
MNSNINNNVNNPPNLQIPTSSSGSVAKGSGNLTTPQQNALNVGNAVFSGNALTIEQKVQSKQSNQNNPTNSGGNNPPVNIPPPPPPAKTFSVQGITLPADQQVNVTKMVSVMTLMLQMASIYAESQKTTFEAGLAQAVSGLNINLDAAQKQFIAGVVGAAGTVVAGAAKAVGGAVSLGVMKYGMSKEDRFKTLPGKDGAGDQVVEKSFSEIFGGNAMHNWSSVGSAASSISSGIGEAVQGAAQGVSAEYSKQAEQRRAFTQFLSTTIQSMMSQQGTAQQYTAGMFEKMAQLASSSTGMISA